MSKDKKETTKTTETKPVTEKKSTAPVYTVAKGCAITSGRGVLDSGTVVDPAWLAEGKAGQEALDALVAAGKVDKK